MHGAERYFKRQIVAPFHPGTAMPTLRRLLIALIVGAAATTVVPAQTDSVRHSTGAMRVAVMDPNGVGLPNAEVELPILDVKFPVPAGGLLLINHVPPGVYVVQVRRLGYAPQTRIVRIRRDTMSVQFALDPVITSLDTVNVNAEGNMEMRDFSRRLRAGNGKFYTSRDIEKTNAVLLKQFLAMVPGVHLNARQGGYSAQSVMGAAGNCPSGVIVYLDGVAVNALEGGDPARSVRALAPGGAAAPRPAAPVRPTTTNQNPSGGTTAQAIATMVAASAPDPLRASGALPAFDIDNISLGQIAAMEVYPSGGPGSLGIATSTKCGLVLLWSKPK
jgi:hypothetical protein